MGLSCKLSRESQSIDKKKVSVPYLKVSQIVTPSSVSGYGCVGPLQSWYHQHLGTSKILQNPYIHHGFWSLFVGGWDYCMDYPQYIPGHVYSYLILFMFHYVPM